MRAVEHQELPHFAGRDQPSQPLIFGIEAAHEANLNAFLSKPLLCLHDFPGGSRVRSQWFLAENRQVPLPNLDQHFFVKETGGRDNDCIDIFPVQGLSDIGQATRRRNCFDSLLRTGDIGVDHDGTSAPTIRRARRSI